MSDEQAPASSWEKLDSRLQRGAVELDEVVSIARLLSTHLDEQHRRHRIDGDLSPGRIEVADGQEPRLLPKGTFEMPKAYIAPEAWADHPTPAADQFSMASILYEALCGGRAFPGDTVEKIRVSITTGQRVPLAARVPGLADAVDGVFEKALAFDPEERYASCSAFADALVAAIEKSRKAEGVLVQKPSSAPRPSSRRQMLGRYELDDGGSPPLPWGKLLLAAVMLMVVAGLIALFSGK